MNSYNPRINLLICSLIQSMNINGFSEAIPHFALAYFCADVSHAAGGAKCCTPV